MVKNTLKEIIAQVLRDHDIDQEKITSISDQMVELICDVAAHNGFEVPREVVESLRLNSRGTEA